MRSEGLAGLKEPVLPALGTSRYKAVHGPVPNAGAKAGHCAVLCTTDTLGIKPGLEPLHSSGIRSRRMSEGVQCRLALLSIQKLTSAASAHAHSRPASKLTAGAYEQPVHNTSALQDCSTQNNPLQMKNRNFVETQHSMRVPYMPHVGASSFCKPANLLTSTPKASSMAQGSQRQGSHATA